TGPGPPVRPPGSVCPAADVGPGRENVQETRWTASSGTLGEDAADDVTCRVGETKIAALVVEGQLLVVDSQEVEHGCVQVVDLNRILDDVVAEVIGLAVGDPRLGPAACHPHGEIAGVMIAARGGGDTALGKDRAAELAFPGNQGVV